MTRDGSRETAEGDSRSTVEPGFQTVLPSRRINRCHHGRRIGRMRPLVAPDPRRLNSTTADHDTPNGVSTRTDDIRCPSDRGTPATGGQLEHPFGATTLSHTAPLDRNTGQGLHLPDVVGHTETQLPSPTPNASGRSMTRGRAGTPCTRRRASRHPHSNPRRWPRRSSAHGEEQDRGGVERRDRGRSRAGRSRNAIRSVASQSVPNLRPEPVLRLEERARRPATERATPPFGRGG